MENIIFQVSAKTARLIGRENISDVDGAIIELVKNGYDADADCVFIRYVIPYDDIPAKLTYSEVQEHFIGHKQLLSELYEVCDGEYVRKSLGKNASDEEKQVFEDNTEQMREYLCSLSKIVVLDNGSGMSGKILSTTWMNIGTSDKENNIVSPIKHRIKTGAKGIGRFALDKLSTRTRVITKNAEDDTLQWEIDWAQFDRAEYLNQVKANLSRLDGSFENFVREYLEEDWQQIEEYNWSTGTLIELSPIRALWNAKLYNKVNSNLHNLNPWGSVDRFDIIVKNKYCREYDFHTVGEGIKREDYDYRIRASFDGMNYVQILLDRNEIDIHRKGIQIKYSDTDIEAYDLNEFWESEAFRKKQYWRADYDGEQKFEYTLAQIIGDNDQTTEACHGVGPFTLEIYYLKNQNSTVEIVKDFKSGRRKNLMNKFSGVKIYRDNFKVRPYGDDGALHDWINLGERVQSSPAAASHESGNWRLSPNQVIGSVSISRNGNPKLEDNANREGMNANREYDAFISIIQGIISKFENDRQYPLREYAAWYRAKKKKHTDLAQEMYEQEKRKREQSKNRKESNDGFSGEYESGRDYTQEEMRDAIYTLGAEHERQLSTNQLLMVLSGAGVMAQTFAHEIIRIGTNLGSRGQHLKAAVDLILHNQPYTGDEDFDPYELIKELDSTDALLSEWVYLIMDSIGKGNFESKPVSLKVFLEHIKQRWEVLLERKYIKIEDIECAQEIELSLPIVDLHLLVNNFLLNSAYYLEDGKSERTINFKVYEDDKHIYLEMKNNGPELDSKYLDNPDITLEARETSKENGTGLGLWIARDATERNGGELHVIPISKGYMIRASWRK